MDLPFDKVLKHDDIKEIGIDYTIVYDFTCLSCNHHWRLSKLRTSVICPKCQSLKSYYVSKRSDSEFFPEDSVIQIPQDSELM